MASNPVKNFEFSLFYTNDCFSTTDPSSSHVSSMFPAILLCFSLSLSLHIRHFSCIVHLVMLSVLRYV